MTDRTLRYVSSTLVGETLIVTLRVDQIREAGAAYELRDELLSLVDETNAKNAIFKLGQVQFVGSIGFLAFLAVRRRLQVGRVFLCELSPVLRQMFTACRLIASDTTSTAPFEVEDTAEASLASIAAS